MTYSWEQYDGGSDAVTGSPDCNSTNVPLFRYRPPNETSIRSFPQYTDVIAGNNDQQWEKLPCATREINFSLTVRDNNTSFGRIAQDLMKITVTNTGPFDVTAPNGGETLTGNATATITWTVNGTNAHCANVDILWSTDNGATYSVIADATANDGTQDITIPNTASTTARVLVRCDVAGGFRSASTFYDVSNAVFTVEEGSASGCDTDLAATDFTDPTPSGDYNASNSIISDKKLAAASAVNFYAGASITLKPGFEVPNGAQFLAKIQACANAQSNEVAQNNAYTSSEDETLYKPIATTNQVVINPTVQIFPNPVREQLNIINKNNNTWRFRLVGLDGVQHHNGQLTTSVQLEVGQLPRGMYFLEFFDKHTGIKITEKLIVANNH